MEHPQTMFENSEGLSLQLLSHVEATHGTFGLIHEAETTSQGVSSLSFWDQYYNIAPCFCATKCD